MSNLKKTKVPKTKILRFKAINTKAFRGPSHNLSNMSFLGKCANSKITNQFNNFRSL